MMYMRRVMSLIQFVRGTRQRNWNLHLATLEGLCIWFLAHNRLDYVQNIPSHIARMYYFKTTNRQVWNDMEKGGLAIKKTHPQLSVLTRHRIPGIKKQYWSFFWDTAWVFQIQESDKMLDMTYKSKIHQQFLTNSTITRQEKYVNQLKMVLNVV